MAAKVVTVTSGKGGVGKTTATANLASALAAENLKVVCIDADIGLRNLDVVLGLENRIVYDLVDVVEGRCRLRQALIRDKRLSELFLLPAAQTRDKSAINPERRDGAPQACHQPLESSHGSPGRDAQYGRRRRDPGHRPDRSCT